MKSSKDKKPQMRKREVGILAERGCATVRQCLIAKMLITALSAGLCFL
jgi:hypothetical protein